MAGQELGVGRHKLPQQATEPVLELRDRRILVVGTNHGQINEGFPGQKQTEEDFRRFESKYGVVDIQANDSQIDLSRVSRSYPIIPGRGIPGLSDFTNWGIVSAMKRGGQLVQADPVKAISELYDLADAEINEENDYYTKINRYSLSLRTTSDTEDLVKSREHLRNIQEVALLVGLGVGVGLGFEHFDKRVSRRNFTTSGTALVAGAIMANIGIALSRVVKDGDIIDQYDKDQTEVVSVINSPGEIDTDMYSSRPYFRFSNYNNDNLKYSIAFRNALMGEVLAVPMNQLTDKNSKKVANIAVTMGSGHLIISEEFRISSMIRDEGFRRATIRALLKRAVAGIQKYGETTGLNVSTDHFLQQIAAYPRRYEIDRTGKVDTKLISVPALSDIANDVRRSV